MLSITIPEREFFNSETNTFSHTESTVLNLEHSLVAISKWESKWHKPFLSDDNKTNEETVDYIRCMTLNKNVDPLVYYSIPVAEQTRIADYIEDSMTATWFSEDKDKPKRKRKGKIITSEVIYGWLVSLNIPFECETWHLNRLLTLIRVCSINNEPKKKMKASEITKRNAELNAARRKALHTSG